MKRIAAFSIAGLMTIALALLAGCSGMLTTSTLTEIPVPAPGPQIKAGLRAVLLPVRDLRYWPPSDSGLASTNVHIFAPRIYSDLQQGLLKTGLFAALPSPDDTQALALQDKVEVTISQFAITKLGSNTWALPAYLVNGLVLPAYAVANVSTKGQMDVGTYFLPSTKVGTTINAAVTYYVANLDKPIVTLFYLEQVKLGAASERRLWADISDQRGFGVSVGKSEGPKVLQKLVQAISRDPHWSYLNQFERLARAKAMFQGSKGSEATPETRLQAALQAVTLLRPLPYSPEEIKTLLDSVLPAGARADLYNEMRARALGYKGADQLPAGQRLDAKGVEALFDDPALGRAQVEATIAEQVIAMALSALGPPPPKKKEAPAKGEAAKEAVAAEKKAEAQPEKPAPLSPQALGLAEKLSDALTAALLGQPQLQVVLLAEADKSVGPAWLPTKAVLLRLQASPQVKEYLARREAS